MEKHKINYSRENIAEINDLPYFDIAETVL